MDGQGHVLEVNRTEILEFGVHIAGKRVTYTRRGHDVARVCRRRETCRDVDFPPVEIGIGTPQHFAGMHADTDFKGLTFRRMPVELGEVHSHFQRDFHRFRRVIEFQHDAVPQTFDDPSHAGLNDALLDPVDEIEPALNRSFLVAVDQPDRIHDICKNDGFGRPLKGLSSKDLVSKRRPRSRHICHSTTHRISTYHT